MRTDPVELDGRIETETERAVLFDDGRQTVWLPLSQISERDDHRDGTVTLEIPEWLAEREGLI